MDLNQVTVTIPDLEEGWIFYCKLGLVPIVDARPNYVRFLCPGGSSTFSVHRGEPVSGGTKIYFECPDLDSTFKRLSAMGITFAGPPENKSWLWREAELTDPGGNELVLYYAGSNRTDPPWRTPEQT